MPARVGSGRTPIVPTGEAESPGAPGASTGGSAPPPGAGRAGGAEKAAGPASAAAGEPPAKTIRTGSPARTPILRATLSPASGSGPGNSHPAAAGPEASSGRASVMSAGAASSITSGESRGATSEASCRSPGYSTS